MCGLAAILDWKKGGWDSEADAVEAVHRALKVMRHRGHPDWSRKILVHGKTILGHIRLPIVDLTHDSDQPMIRGGTALAFVGEIFNYKKLNPQAKSDTEVFLDTLLYRGTSGLHRFDGFWSAVYVNLLGPMVLTDYLSQKPLYFNERALLVVSEPDAAVAALPDLSLEIDQTYLSNVLKWGYDPTGRTPYAGLVQLPAGSILTIHQGLRIAPYWDWLRVPQPQDLRSALTQATANRLVGDRPVSLLLSGGLDSTIIFKVLTQYLGRKDVRVLHTENNEAEFVEEALRGETGVRSTGLLAPEVSLHDALIAHQVPVDLGSMLPQTSLARAVHDKGFFVCMSGDGADELFGGYRRAKEYDSQASDVFMELPYYHLPRLDRIMMRSTVELRSPYLAPQVIKYALSLPWKTRTEKQALKDVFVDIVPDRILNREKFPLKSQQVLKGGLEWRQTIINQWERMRA